MWGVTVKLCVFVWRWRVSAIILSAKVRIGFAAVCVTAKGHELTRSLAVEFLPRMATNLHEALRRSFYHEEPRIYTKPYFTRVWKTRHPCFFIEKSAGWLRVSSWPFVVSFILPDSFAALSGPSRTNTFCRMASCKFVALRGKLYSAVWLRGGRACQHLS